MSVAALDEIHFDLDHGLLKRLRMLVEIDQNVLPGGRRLKLRGPQLADLPSEVFFLSELEVLDLSPEREACLYYQVTEVPADIVRLVNLRVLMLDTNNLYQLPDELCSLTKLERLSLSNNRLSLLPKAFDRLVSLRSLHLANNAFVTCPESLCSLRTLQFLDLSDNRIITLPSCIARLRSLETLLLYSNALARLPDAICNLTELRTLWVGRNNLSRLPRDFGKLTKLDWGGHHTVSSAVDGNPLQSPPLYICKQGVSAIARYFAFTQTYAKKAIRKRPTPNRRMSDVPEEIIDS